MSNMKYSGIEWIGNIPEEWSLKRLRYLCSFKTGGTPDDRYGINFEGDGYPWITAQDMNNGMIIKKYTQFITEESRKLCKYKLFPKGSVLIVCIASVGKLGYTIDETYSNQQITSLMPNNLIDGKYLLYLISSQTPMIVKDASSNVVPIINTQYLQNILCCLPKKEEQKLIADFLDKKVKTIDDIIDDLNKEINILNNYKKQVISEIVTKGLNKNVEYKDSEIQWIGKIPKHWNIKKLKYILKGTLTYGANESGDEFNEESPRYIRITDIDENNKLKEDGKLSLDFDLAKSYLLHDQDILFARSGATVGKTYLYSINDGLAAYAGYLIKASINENLAFPKYVYYTTLGTGYDNWKNSIFTQATIQNIGADKYSVYKVPLPSIEEQKEIVKYLDDKCSQIDKIIEKKKTQLELMEQYKKSVIYEYVTGKKRVEGAEELYG